jgi:tripartite-type tricarboxylate transporter receptor subunit TctC
MKKLLATALLLFSATVWSADITTIVVTFPPGGAADTNGRIAADILTEHGIPTVVLNKPGAESVIGINYAAKAVPDGRTLLIGGDAMGANYYFKTEGMEYNKDSFSPVTTMAELSFTLAVKSDSSIKNYDEFKKFVRAHPDKFNVSFWNNNLATIFKDWAKREGLPTPKIILYKGTAAALPDVIGGHTEFAFDTWFGIRPYAEDGKLRPLASLNVNKAIPKSMAVPAISNKYPELNYSVLYGLWAPAGTPRAKILELNAVIAEGMKEEKYRKRIEALTTTVYGGSPEQLQAAMDRNCKIIERLAAEYTPKQ